MKFSNGYIFGFSAVVCIVASLAVSSVSISLRERQEVNRQRDLRKNILSSLGLPAEGDPPIEGDSIDAAWEEYVDQRFITPSGAAADVAQDQDGNGLLDVDDLKLAVRSVKNTEDTPPVLGVFLRVEDGTTRSVAIPLDGNGLWGPLTGYLALDPRAKEITGATFFAPKETPGLGAEIMEPKFKGQWVGKSVTDGSGNTTAVRVVKGAATNLCPDDLEHCVDGISGATITSRGVDAMVAEALQWYDPYLSGLRGG